MNLYAFDMDTCPKTDAILTRYDCSGCPYYQGFSMEDGLPCTRCSYYDHADED